MKGWVQYLKTMRRVLSHRGRRLEEIEDLMQDAAVRLLEYCEDGTEVREPEAVLVRTVQRLAMNRARDAHSDLYVEESVEDLNLIDPNPTPEEVLSGEQCLVEIRQVLDAVSRRTREVFLMHRLHGFSYAQIAKQMELPVSTVEKHMARAMTVLIAKQRNEMLKP
jgi:RNA polymerase sigma factor (sigma-70 family)